MKFCTKCGTQMYDVAEACPQCHTKCNNQQTQTKISNSTPDTNSTPNKHKKAYLCPIIIGVILILVGLFIQVPGGVLTTFESLDGDKTGNYVFDDKYSSIDEYVGGDAYNYIIGASLVAGKISGAMTSKAIFIVAGALCLCLGITLKSLISKEENN